MPCYSYPDRREDNRPKAYGSRAERKLPVLLGFTDFRVRLRDGGALLQFTEKQHGKAENELEAIKAELSRLFDTVKLDPKARIESK